ncbi:protein of unknown function (plasmid) [Cupriavidus neocaledonicus]|uniref:Uncharacterized protein n=1 Tax=Cupriavidus neocaledonicus TaxID=1040979 RepID=A0A375HSP3_9BURK|nr:protein of unknown function [Cupriavidus neocaledonicus]
MRQRKRVCPVMRNIRECHAEWLLDFLPFPAVVQGSSIEGEGGYRRQDTLIVMSALRRALCRRCPWLA